MILNGSIPGSLIPLSRAFLYKQVAGQVPGGCLSLCLCCFDFNIEFCLDHCACVDFARLRDAFFLHDDHYFGRKSINTGNYTSEILLNVYSFIVTVEESNTCINKNRLFNAAAVVTNNHDRYLIEGGSNIRLCAIESTGVRTRGAGGQLPPPPSHKIGGAEPL